MTLIRLMPSAHDAGMKALAIVLLAMAAQYPAHAAPSEFGISPDSIPDIEARQQALKLLCPIAQQAGGSWGDDNINRAIASIQWGEEWPPNRAQSSAYKLCLQDGYLR